MMLPGDVGPGMALSQGSKGWNLQVGTEELAAERLSGGDSGVPGVGFWGIWS